MAINQVAGIVPASESTIHDEPHLEGSRITVRYLARQVEDRELHPLTVAARHDLDVADVYAALNYYHANPEAMDRVEQRRNELSEKAAARTTLHPPENS